MTAPTERKLLADNTWVYVVDGGKACLLGVNNVSVGRSRGTVDPGTFDTAEPQPLATNKSFPISFSGSMIEGDRAFAALAQALDDGSLIQICIEYHWPSGSIEAEGGWARVTEATKSVSKDNTLSYNVSLQIYGNLATFAGVA